jgi:hypothetical protein
MFIVNFDVHFDKKNKEMFIFCNNVLATSSIANGQFRIEVL